MKFFNTAGPVDKEKHYSLDPLSRIDFEELLSLIQQEKFFVVHAPRQTGKTSVLLALMDHLNREGHFSCVYVNVEPAQTAREDVGAAMRTILGALAHSLDFYLDDKSLIDKVDDLINIKGPHLALQVGLMELASTRLMPVPESNCKLITRQHRCDG